MHESHGQREQDLLAEVAHTGILREDTVAIPGTAVSVRVTRPANIDRLLDRVVADPEQNLPYWAELWPSGIGLAAFLLRHRELVSGKHILELGCGLGITAAIAMSIGADLLATDYAAESLTLTRLTCIRHCDREPETARVNWRDPGEPSLSGSRLYPVVLAADVLYERRDVEPLLDLMDRLLEPDGVVLLAEPGRNPARVFLEQAADRGWAGPQFSEYGPWPNPKDEGVEVRVNQLSRGLLALKT